MAATSTGRLELYIGTFIVAGVILLTGMIIVTNESFALWSDTYIVVVRINHVSDLQEGAPVKLGGVRIGSVKEINLCKGHIELTTEIAASVELTADCRASIENSGLVGDTFLEFIQGQSSDILPRDVHSPQAFVQRRGELGLVEGIGSVSMNEIFNQLKAIGTEVIALTRNVNDIVGDAQVKMNIKEAIANVNTTSMEAKRLLVSLRRSSENVYDASRNIAETTERVKRMSATFESAVNQTVGDKRNVEAINETIANARRISRSADSLLGRVDKIIGDEEQNIKETVENLKGITAQVKTVADKIGPDTGIMRLFTSEDMKKDMTAAVEWLKTFVSHEGVIKALQLKRYADEIATKRLKEWRSSRISADELQQKVLEQLKEGLGGKKEAKDIIRREEEGY